jgi:Mg2+/citrate symporter
VRYWLPLLAALVCLIVATKVSPIVSFVLIIAAFGLVIEVSTKLFEQSGRGGRLTDHRQ